MQIISRSFDESYENLWNISMLFSQVQLNESWTSTFEKLFFVNTHKHIHEVFLKTQNCSKKPKLWIKTQRSSRNCSAISLCWYLRNASFHTGFMHQQALLPPIHPTSGYQQTWLHKFMLALSIVPQSMVNSYILASPYFLLLHSCPHLFETAGSSLQLATAPLTCLSQVGS